MFILCDTKYSYFLGKGEKMNIYEKFGVTSNVAIIIISVSVMLFGGFAMTRITKKLKLPNVTAYIITGILLGPYVLNLVPQNVVTGMDFLSDIALAFIAFSTGEFFEFSVLKKSGSKVIVITIFESLMASFLIFIVMFFILKMNLAFSIVLSALAAATAPASTVMTIRQIGAKGDFVNTLLQVVALDDIVGLLAYSIAISIATASMNVTDSIHILSIIKPLGINIAVFIVGGIFGLLMKLLMTQKRTTDNRLIISIAMIFLFCGICSLLDISPLLGCMSMGTIYINISKDDKLFKQLNYFNPPILLLFFVRSGVSFNLGILTGSGSLVGNVSVLTFGILYFITRIIGKYTGAFLGCLITGKSAEVRNYLGLALIPQAGVAIGLASLCVRSLGNDVGVSLQTIILASSVLYELIGPGCAKLALYLSHSYSDVLENLTEVSETTDSGTPKTQVEILIERLQQIQEELPSRLMMENDAEQAFTQAAEEQYENYGTYSTYSKGHFLNLK